MDQLLTALALPFWAMALAQLVGIPVAWIKVRGSSEWRGRPEGERRLDVLARFIRPVTEYAGLWAIVVAVFVVIGSAIS